MGAAHWSVCRKDVSKTRLADGVRHPYSHTQPASCAPAWLDIRHNSFGVLHISGATDFGQRLLGPTA